LRKIADKIDYLDKTNYHTIVKWRINNGENG